MDNMIATSDLFQEFEDELRKLAARQTEHHSLGDDKVLRTHSALVCGNTIRGAGEICVLHNPSNHHMIEWPLVFRSDRHYLGYRICQHNQAHTDPDSLAYFIDQYSDADQWQEHDCDGCCIPRPKLTIVSEDTVFPPPPQASTVTVDETPSRVQLIAWTFVSAEVYDKLDHQDDPTNVGYMDADILAEYAGRTCYQSWSKPNPETATNAGYLRNVIDHQHFSVLEHASATFLITGVSRSLLAELSRHRHLSLSVESQRYVPQDEGEPVIPPLLRKYPAITDVLICAHKASIGDYEEIITALMARQADGDKLTKKEIREAARSVLLNSQPVSMVVTGNLRAWREVLTKRYHIAADAEIRELAGELLTILRRVAPNSFSDFPNQPFGNDTIRRSA